MSHGVAATVMKNCEPFVFGPEFAIASLPGLSNLCGEPLVSSWNLIARAAHAGARRIAALHHEVGDDAMEDGAVVQRRLALGAGLRMRPLARAFGKLDEVLHRDGSLLLKQSADNGSFAGIKRGINTGLT